MRCSSDFQMCRLKPFPTCGAMLVMKKLSLIASADHFIAPAGARCPRSYPVPV